MVKTAQYDLITGLTALAAYGVLLIANNELIKARREDMMDQERVTDTVTLFFAYNLVIAGVTILATTLVRIVLDSSLQTLITEKGAVYASFGLLFPIIIPQIWFFVESISKVLREDNVNEKFGGMLGAIYGLLVSLLTGQNFSKYLPLYILYLSALPFFISPSLY